MLAGGDQALLGAGAVQFGAGLRGLCGQHHRFRRSTRLQPLASAGHSALSLCDVELRDIPLALGRDDRQVMTRHLGEQVQPTHLTLNRKHIDTTLRQGTARIELADALEAKVSVSSAPCKPLVSPEPKIILDGGPSTSGGRSAALAIGEHVATHEADSWHCCNVVCRAWAGDASQGGRLVWRLSWGLASLQIGMIPITINLPAMSGDS